MSEHTLQGIHDLHEDAYRLAQGVSKSMLDKLAYPKTPAHLRAYLDEPKEPPTDAMMLGTALHAALLQPERRNAFKVRPSGLDFRTKEGKEWKAENEAFIIITEDQNAGIVRMVDNVWKHPVAKRMLAGSDYERSVFATDDHGTLRKGRVDVLTKAGNILPDVKTCESAAPDDFEKSVVSYRYFVQAAYYLDLCAMTGIDREHFCFICIEKNPPHLVAVHQLDPMVVEWGRKVYQRDLTVYRQCIESGQWPGYDESVNVIGVPSWARKQMEETV